MVNNKMVDINGLQRYHNNLKEILADNLAEAKKHADELAGNYDEKGAAAQALVDAKADAANLYQVKGNYEAEGAAAQALADAKADAESKYQVKGEYEESGAAAQALEAAKADAAGKYQVKGDYEEAGAAAQALADAKADAAEKYQVKGNYEIAGTAAGLNATMDERVAKLEAIDHDKLAADAAAAAVTTVLDGAPEAFNTLKEVAEWIGNNDHAEDVATLVTDVANLKAIDHTAYVAADETNLAAAKAYADSLAVNYDAAGAATQALADAKADAAEKYQVKGNYETEGAAATAESNAKAYADGLAVNYDAAGAAATAQTNANSYTDAEVAKKQNIIDDLATIRNGAALGATALQTEDLQFATDAEIDELFGIFVE